MSNGKPILVLMVGLPRSGKSTWAAELRRREGAVAVNPDSFRLAIHGQRFVASAEGFVWASVRAAVEALFLTGHELMVLDACNVTRKLRDTWRVEDGRWRTLCKVVWADPSSENVNRVVCRVRAVNEGRNDLLPVIDRMAEQWEPLGEGEESWEEHQDRAHL